MSDKRIPRRDLLRVAGAASLLAGLEGCHGAIAPTDTSRSSNVSIETTSKNEMTVRIPPADDRPKPFMAKFEVPMPKDITEAEFNAKLTGTGPKTTHTGGFGTSPPDTAADVDVDF
jgi:hypothetical protein